MTKKIEKLFKSYREQLLHLAKLYNIVEIKSYARSSKRLTIAQLELLLIKNRIKLPVNRSSDKAMAKQELKENSIRNIYLSFGFIFLIACFIVMRPYIKNTVNEVKFTYVAEEYKSTKVIKSKKKKEKKITKEEKPEINQTYDNTVSLNAETTLNLFNDLGYDLKGIRAGQKVKPIFLTKLPKDLKSMGNTKNKRELFIKIILPLILAENQKIEEDRKKLFKILGKNFNTVGERVWLKRRFKEYKIDDKDLSKLKNLNPVLKAMWLEGRWDVFAGTFFDNWNPMHHVIPKSNFQYGVHFKKNTHTLYRFYDYGTKAPFVCLFAAVDRDQNMIVFDEITETGLSASKQAKLVNQYTWENYKLKPNDFDDDIADPAYWTKHSEKEGALYSPADFYGDEGIFLSRGNNDRKAGAKLVYEGLEVPDEGDPRVRFTENCLQCIETFPNLPSAENDPEDIDTKADDHHYDALRYGSLKVLPSLAIYEKRKKGWRYRIGQTNSTGSISWKTA